MEALSAARGAWLLALGLLWSCDNTCKSQPESQTLYFKGKCGPDATVMASVDNACHVTLAGAQAAGLPEHGALNGTGSQPPGALLKEGVNFFDADGGAHSCSGIPADGGLSVICHQPCPDVDAGDNCDLQCDGFFSVAP